MNERSQLEPGGGLPTIIAVGCLGLAIIALIFVGMVALATLTIRAVW